MGFRERGLRVRLLGIWFFLFTKNPEVALSSEGPRSFLFWLCFDAELQALGTK